MTPKTKVNAASRLNPEKPITGRDATREQLQSFVSTMIYNAGFDVPDKIIKRQKKDDLLKIVNNMASLVSRSALQSALGQSFNGRRDLYEVLGWKKELTFPDYLMMYERNGIAARVVDLKADESWREFFTLHDGKTAEDYQDDTPFLEEWGELVENFDLPSVLHELDTALGISRFAVIVVGITGDEGSDYGKPLEPNKEGRVISWLRVLDEGMVQMSEPDSNPFSKRYGLPTIYRCQFEQENQGGGQAVPVHYTRVMHFKQGRGRSSTYGIPGLKKSFNYLQDLDKVVGSSSEAFWQHIRRAIALVAREGFTMPESGTPEYTGLQDQVERWEHQMSLVLKLRNMDVQDLSAQAVDGNGQRTLLIAQIAGSEGIPQRILDGSERGELASSQDVVNLGNSIAARQKKTCSPWVKQVVRYMYMNKFISPPTSGKFTIEWLPLYKPTPMEKIDIAKGEVDVLSAVTDGNVQEVMTIEDFMDRHFDNYRMKKGKGNGKASKTGGGGVDLDNEPDIQENDAAAGLKDQNPNSQEM